MKIKQHVYISDPARFLRGDHNVISLFERELMDPDPWIHCGEITLDINPDTGKMIELAKKTFDKEILIREGEIELLKQKRSELLALDAPVDEKNHG